MGSAVGERPQRSSLTTSLSWRGRGYGNYWRLAIHPPTRTHSLWRSGRRAPGPARRTLESPVPGDSPRRVQPQQHHTHHTHHTQQRWGARHHRACRSDGVGDDWKNRSWWARECHRGRGGTAAAGHPNKTRDNFEHSSSASHADELFGCSFSRSRAPHLRGAVNASGEQAGRSEQGQDLSSRGHDEGGVLVFHPPETRRATDSRRSALGTPRGTQPAPNAARVVSPPSMERPGSPEAAHLFPSSLVATAAKAGTELPTAPSNPAELVCTGVGGAVGRVVCLVPAERQDPLRALLLECASVCVRARACVCVSSSTGSGSRARAAVRASWGGCAPSGQAYLRTDPSGKPRGSTTWMGCGRRRTPSGGRERE